MKLRERRDFYRGGLHALYLPVYEGICSELSPEWQPYYGLRDFHEQDLLYAIGRTTPGEIVTDAQSGESAHNYGCASDWVIWDDQSKPVWIKSSDTKWKELSDAVKNAGGNWGGYFKNTDCPHVELKLKIAWKAVRGVFISQGLPSAMQYVRENLA